MTFFKTILVFGLKKTEFGNHSYNVENLKNLSVRVTLSRLGLGLRLGLSLELGYGLTGLRSCLHFLSLVEIWNSERSKFFIWIFLFGNENNPRRNRSSLPQPRAEHYDTDKHFYRTGSRKAFKHDKRVVVGCYTFKMHFRTCSIIFYISFYIMVVSFRFSSLTLWQIWGSLFLQNCSY